MNYNIVFTIYGLVFIILLLITLVVKKRKKTIRTKTYSIIIIFSLIYSLTEIISIYTLIYFPSSRIGAIFKVFNNICMFNLLTFFVLYYLVIYYELDKKYDKLLSAYTREKYCLILCIIDIVASLFYMFISRNKVIILDNLNFISTSFGFTLLGICFIVLSFCSYMSWRKKLKNLFKCYLIILIVLLLILPFQIGFSHISFLPVLVMLMIFIIYYVVENPDIELLEDVTRLKSEIDKSSNTKMDFLFNLSYDLVIPISNIVSLSKSLSDMDTLDKEQALNDLNNIKYAGNTLLDSINNILDKGIGENNKEINKEYSVVELVKRLESVVQSRIGAKQVSFELSVDNNVYSNLIGDINKIQKVLLNVLNNAVKYTEVGKVKMDITASNNKNIQTLNFVILDTGCGIKEDDFNSVFTDSTEESSGVGLAISKQFVESMNGTISFKSVYGAGTTFFISIPQTICTTNLYVDDSNVEDESSIDEIIDCSNYKLAIVDDDSLDIKVTLKLLKKYNFNIEVITSTVDFINKIKCEEKYDLVFLDHKMPVFDGVRTLNSLKQLESYELPKFVCFTANAINGAREYYRSEGFDEYLAKPIDVKELDRIIKKFCKK